MYPRFFAVPLLLLLLTGCSSSSVEKPSTQPDAAPAQDQSIAPTSGPLPEETGATETTDGEQTASARQDDPTLITLGQPERAKRPLTLAEASARALEERRRRGLERLPSGPVITNENLSEFAAEGQVTFSPDSTSAGGTTDPAGAAEDSREAFWRRKVREIRTAWADAHEQIGILEEEAASLRWRFYAEDDGYFRDERIKPEWDRTLDALRQARQDAREHEERLEEVLEGGRRAGALPGWLREGIELEPQREAEDDSQPRRQDPIPPPIYDPDGLDF
ncbi:MAG: hypothetical protein AAF481_04115 [Acidobacteriota bacterium]